MYKPSPNFMFTLSFKSTTMTRRESDTDIASISSHDTTSWWVGGNSYMNESGSTVFFYLITFVLKSSFATDVHLVPVREQVPICVCAGDYICVPKFAIRRTLSLILMLQSGGLFRRCLGRRRRRLLFLHHGIAAIVYI